MRRTLLYLLLIAAISPVAARAQVVLIANDELKAESISKDDLREVFTGAAAHLRIKPVLLRKGPVHTEFLATYIGVEEGQFHADWMKLLFSGKMVLPPTVDTEKEVVDYVAHHSNCVGYIHKETPHPGLRVLTLR